MNEVSSPKRSTSEQEGLHAWLPYYAGFSEAFVEDMIDNLGLTPDHLILDPMSGSGTTSLVAQDRGHLSIAVELNPAMAIISRAKDRAFAHRRDLIDIASSVARQARHPSRRTFPSHATEWFSRPVLRKLTALADQIMALEGTPMVPLQHRLAGLVDGRSPEGGRVGDFLLAALLLTARSVSRSEKTKNPTWLRPDQEGGEKTIDVERAFLETVAQMVEDLTSAFPSADSSQPRRSLFLHGDARALPLPDESVDAVITSPPYLTRIDYAVGTTPELIALGHHTRSAFRGVRTQLMGSTCVTGGPYEADPTWGETCIDVLERVREHPSKASAGYYLKMHIQYFRDAEAIVREALRVLRAGSSAAFVVQGSWYKNIHIPLGEIYRELALNCGAGTASIVRSETVSRHMGLVNSQARKYKKGALQEHVVLFSRTQYA